MKHVISGISFPATCRLVVQCHGTQCIFNVGSYCVHDCR